MSDFELCVITSESVCPPGAERGGGEQRRSHLEVARAALQGGCRLIQLRDKAASSRRLWALGTEMRLLTRDYGARLIVNDRLDVALAVEADGVHLGDEDLPLREARRLLGREAIIGASVSTPEEAEQAQAEGASYLGVGPIYPTASKAEAGQAVGPAMVAQIRREVSLPLLAIGGIDRDNAGEAIRAGADGAAVISAVAQAEDMVAATAGLLEAIRAARRPAGGRPNGRMVSGAGT